MADASPATVVKPTAGEPARSVVPVLWDFTILLGPTLLFAWGYWAALHACLARIGPHRPDHPEEHFSQLVLIPLGHCVLPQSIAVHAAAYILLLAILLYRAFTGRRTTLGQQVHLLGWLLLPLPVLVWFECLLCVPLVALLMVGAGLGSHLSVAHLLMVFQCLLLGGMVLVGGYLLWRGLVVWIFPPDEPLWPEPDSPAADQKGDKPEPEPRPRVWWRFSIASLLLFTATVAVCLAFPWMIGLVVCGAIRTHLMSLADDAAGETMSSLSLIVTFVYSTLLPVAILLPGFLITFTVFGIVIQLEPMPSFVNWRPVYGDLLLAWAWIIAFWLTACLAWLLVPRQRDLSEIVEQWRNL